MHFVQTEECTDGVRSTVGYVNFNTKPVVVSTMPSFFNSDRCKCTVACCVLLPYFAGRRLVHASNKMNEQETQQRMSNQNTCSDKQKDVRYDLLHRHIAVMCLPVQADTDARPMVRAELQSTAQGTAVPLVHRELRLNRTLPARFFSPCGER
jgi:hypothetical protein